MSGVKRELKRLQDKFRQRHGIPTAKEQEQVVAEQKRIDEILEQERKPVLPRPVLPKLNLDEHRGKQVRP